jgi:hypothetical protein
MRKNQNDVAHVSEDDVTLYLDPCGELALPPRGWSRLLSLAQQYDWHPAGTEPPEKEYLYEGDRSLLGDLSEWDGRYFPGFLQHVATEDARMHAGSRRPGCAHCLTCRITKPSTRRHRARLEELKELLKP